MTMWKRVLSVILIAALGVSLCGCPPRPPKVNVNIGDEMTMGKYGNNPIEWIVLDMNDDGDALVISKYILDMLPYNQDASAVTWEECWLREWLNNEFYSTSFNKEEQNKILTTKLKNPDNIAYGIPGGNDTSDKVFLLSYDEADSLFAGSKERRAKPTSYALDKGIMVSMKGSSEGCAPWWLRSPGRDVHSAVCVRDIGYILNSGYNVYYEGYGVRPAMWVKLS